jgi:hypothetical protein
MWSWSRHPISGARTKSAAQQQFHKVSGKGLISSDPLSARKKVEENTAITPIHPSWLIAIDLRPRVGTKRPSHIRTHVKCMMPKAFTLTSARSVTETCPLIYVCWWIMQPIAQRAMKDFDKVTSCNRGASLRIRGRRSCRHGVLYQKRIGLCRGWRKRKTRKAASAAIYHNTMSNQNKIK